MKLPRLSSRTFVLLRKLHLNFTEKAKKNFKTELPLASEIFKKWQGKPETLFTTSWVVSQYLSDSIDGFGITLLIKTCVRQLISGKPPPDPVQKPIQDALKCKELLFSDSWSDVIVVCGEKEFKAHRLILASQSKVFDAIFRLDMESKSGRVELTESKPELVEQLLKYMYTRENPEESEVSEMVVELFRVAHKYDVGGLQNFCESLLLKSVTVDNVFEMYEVAVVHSIDSLRSHAFDLIKRNKKELFGDATKFQQIATKHPNIIYELLKSTY